MPGGADDVVPTCTYEQSMTTRRPFWRASAIRASFLLAAAAAVVVG